MSLGLLGPSSGGDDMKSRRRWMEGYAELKSKFPTLMKGAETGILAGLDRKKKKGKIQVPITIPILGMDTITGAASGGIEEHDKYRTKTAAGLNLDKVLENSKLTSRTSEATPILGKRKLKAIRKKERERTKGPKWYGMNAPEMTEDRKNDLEALSLRGALDTKRFYKRNVLGRGTKPKYFQVGKVVENKADWYNSRLSKKERKKTIAEEFMSEVGG